MVGMRHVREIAEQKRLVALAVNARIKRLQELIKLDATPKVRKDKFKSFILEEIARDKNFKCDPVYKMALELLNK